MSQEKQCLLGEMEPLVKKVLDCGDERAIEKLVNLNEKMIQTNVREGLFPVEHCVPVPHLIGANKKRRCLVEIVQNSLGSDEDLKQAEAARGELQTLQSKLREYMTELMLPPSWTFEIPHVDIHRPAGLQPLSSANRDDVYSAGCPDTQPSDAMDTAHDWKPGETTKGEKILGYRPRTRTGRDVRTFSPTQIFDNVRFVIECDGDRNPIKIVEEDQVGSPAVAAYLALAEEQKCNIANVDRRYGRLDGFNFGSIKGIARDPNATGFPLPWAVVWIEYNGEPRLINRSALRNAMGQKRADRLINEFLISVEEEPDAPIEERRSIQNDQRFLLPAQYPLGGRPGNRSATFQTDSQRMLSDREELYYNFDSRNFPRATMPAHSQRLNERGSRRDQFNYQDREPAQNTPRESHRSASARLQGPTPVRRAPSAQPASRMGTVDTPPDVTRDEEQHRTGAAGNEPAALEAKVNALTVLLAQLVTQVGNLQRSQEPAAARR